MFNKQIRLEKEALEKENHFLKIELGREMARNKDLISILQGRNPDMVDLFEGLKGIKPKKVKKLKVK